MLAEWAGTGGLWLTGWPDEAPAAPEAPVAARLGAAAALLATVTEALGRRVDVDLPALVSGRAALSGHTRRGRTSAGGSCRLLPAADGWVAVNLARPSDIEAVGALAGTEGGRDPWTAVGAAVARAPASDVVERAQLLGIAAAQLGRHRDGVIAPPTLPWGFSTLSLPGPRRRRSPTVVDLSAMWAGPMCAHLLGRAGARVIKVDSAARPDGARFGDRTFFDWLHGGHASVVLDFGEEGGRRDLIALLETADVVIEASRPRALQQLGIDAPALVRHVPGLTWISITGYGRWGRWANRVAFGDDAAVAGGLVGCDGAGQPVFCGDALADPITGLFAAVAAAASVAAGGGHLVDVAMSAVAAYVASPAGMLTAHDIASTPGGGWRLRHDRTWHDIRPPAAPPKPEPARPMGADTAAVLAAIDRLPAR